MAAAAVVSRLEPSWRRPLLRRLTGFRDADARSLADDFYRRRGWAIWSRELAARSPRRLCRHLHLQGWQRLTRTESSAPGHLLLATDVMWWTAACALAYYHRPMTVVADAYRQGEAGRPSTVDIPQQRLQLLPGILAEDLGDRLRRDETVLWVLGHNDLQCLAAGDDTAPSWVGVAEESAVPMTWIRAEPASSTTVRLVLDAFDPWSVGHWRSAVGAALGRQLAADTLAFPWEWADASLVRGETT